MHAQVEKVFLAQAGRCAAEAEAAEHLRLNVALNAKLQDGEHQLGSMAEDLKRSSAEAEKHAGALSEACARIGASKSSP